MHQFARYYTSRTLRTLSYDRFRRRRTRGDKLVRLVYVDEAGIGNPQQEPWLVVAGVIVDADRILNVVERHLDHLVDHYIPEEHRDGFVFHAAELFNGGGKVFVREPADTSNPRWPLHKRLEIARELAAIPKTYALPIAIGTIERQRFPQTFQFPSAMKEGAKTVVAHLHAYMQCAMSVDFWMRSHTVGEVCLMVVEENDQARQLIKETQNIHQMRNIERSLSENERRYFPFQRIKQSPLFEEKRKSSVLQLADFCAYVFKRYRMGDTKRYEPFIFPWISQVAADGPE